MKEMHFFATFSTAYPHYINWIDTSGEENRDWYEKDVDGGKKQAVGFFPTAF